MTRLIDADALKEQFKDRSLEDFTYLHFIDAINNAPTVDADLSEYSDKLWKTAYERGKNERPQGKWIEHYSKEMSEKGYFLCSKCKCGFQRFARGVRHSDLPWIDGQKYELHYIDNFCPNCGADMRGEEGGRQ